MATSTKTRMVAQLAPYNPRQPPEGERYVHIKICYQDLERAVHKSFPLSLLLKFSRSAQEGLGQYAEPNSPAPRVVDWNIPITEFHQVLEHGGLTVVLRWFLQLPARGFSKNYAGRPQITEELLEPLNLIQLLRVHEAIDILKLSEPLNRQKGPRGRILEHLYQSPLQPDQLAMIWELFNKRDRGLVKYACNMTIDFINEKYLSPADIELISKLRQDNKELNDMMSGMEAGKEKRLANKERQKARQAQREKNSEYKARHQAFLARKAEREACQKEIAQDRIERARNGEIALNERDLDAFGGWGFSGKEP